MTLLGSGIVGWTLVIIVIGFYLYMKGHQQ
jgi:hypothetical protein